MPVETFDTNKCNDAYFTLGPINWCLKIFALCSVRREKNTLISINCRSKILSLVIVLGILNILFLFFKIKILHTLLGDGPVKFTDFMQFVYIYGYFEYVVSVYCVYRNKQSCLNYFKIYNNIDNILGVTYVSVTRKIIITYFSFFIILFIFTSIFDYVAWSSADWILSTLYCPDYIYAFLNLLSLVDFISQIILVESRLKLIKKFLLVYYSNSIPILGTGKVLKEDGWTIDPLEAKINNRLNHLKKLHCKGSIEISSFTKCYLLLLEQIIYLNKAYGIRVLFYCWNVLYYMITLINAAIRVSTGILRPEETPALWYLPAITSVIALINYTGVTFVLLYRCEKCYRYVENIVQITDLTLQNKNLCFNDKSEFQNFRNVVVSRPIQFHAANFFTLDYTLLISGTTMVITYTIIMLQSVQ